MTSLPLLAQLLTALALAADPGPPPAEPAPAAEPAAQAGPPAAAPGIEAPVPAWVSSPVTVRLSAGLGPTNEMGKDDGNVTAMAAAVLFRLGPILLGPEVALHWFPGAPASEGGARGVSGALLLGSSLPLAGRLRLAALAEGGIQTYWLSRDTFVGTRSGGDGQLPFAGARLGVDYLVRQRSTIGVFAVFRHTLGSSTERYTETVCALGCSAQAGEVRYGGVTFGLEVAASIGFAGGG